MYRYLLHVLVAIDQFLTTLVGGYPDESLSSYAYRMERQGKPWGVTRKWIDALFFLAPGHCERAYSAERTRAQMPPELRG
jgi:hypothetical protein